METVFKEFAPYGLGGLLAGANLIIIWVLTREVIPKMARNFRIEIRIGRKAFLRALNHDRDDFRAELAAERQSRAEMLDSVKDELQSLRGIIEDSFRRPPHKRV